MNQKKLVGTEGTTRRDFVKKGAAAMAGLAAAPAFFRTPVYGQHQAPAPPGVLGANDRLHIGFIGVGLQGFNGHVRPVKRAEAQDNVIGSAVCDVYSTYTERARAELGLAAADAYSDHRRLLERDDIDGVIIATVDHWHAGTAIDAMNAGKHVYLEKPMTRYLQEAFDVHDTVLRTGVVFQYGSQMCSQGRWHKAAEMVRAGKIGAPILAQASYMRNKPDGEWNYAIDPDVTPQTLDWKQWLGPVSDRPFSAEIYFRWKKYFPYNAGIMGNLLPHRLAPLMMASGNPEYPRRVVCLGTKKVTPDRDIPDSMSALAEFPSGLTLLVVGSTVTEQGLPEIVRGHEGTLTFGGDTVQLTPERPFGDLVDPEEHSNLKPGGSVPEHRQNWYDAIRNGAPINGTIDLATKIQTVISLAEMSERLGHMMFFDEKTRKVTNGDGKEILPIAYGTHPLT